MLAIGYRDDIVSLECPPDNGQSLADRFKPDDNLTITYEFDCNPKTSTIAIHAHPDLHLINYIPAGCLRLEREPLGITVEDWEECDDWKCFAHPRDCNLTLTENLLSRHVQSQIFESPGLQSYQSLLWADWVKFEFKVLNASWGQVRAYILPDDVARIKIDRTDATLKKRLSQLLSQLDVAPDTWRGIWTPNTPIQHVDLFSSDDRNGETDDDNSLFYLFNTLPSPNPDLQAVKDLPTREAMTNILSNDVKGLTTSLFTYQQRSAAMMAQREAYPPQIIDPRLRPLTDQNGKVWYCDTVTAACVREPRIYEAARGGICAETMGLGKTLICLALILATKDLFTSIPVEYSVDTIPVRPKVGSLLDMAASCAARSGAPWKRYFDCADTDEESSEFLRCTTAIRRNCASYTIPSPPPRRATRRPTVDPPQQIYLSATSLVVVPNNLVQQWQHEIEKHTVGLKVLVMKNIKKTVPTALELIEYDIILFSKTRFEAESHELPWMEPEKDRAYRSPLRDVHFKRLITDEGHTMGNSSSNVKSQAVIVADFINASARWIVSGTPTPGLYGVDSQMTEISEFVDPESDINFDLIDSRADVINAEREKKDLEKLGNIATYYLKSAPWATTFGSNDGASWSQYVMQPRHGSRSQGTPACLRATLQDLIIRHRPADIEAEIALPPLYQKTVYLEGSLLDKISLNLFALMINSNAVTSERKDADYLFHPKQRKALGSLVTNLRQASFFWSGFIKEDVEVTIQIAKTFLEKDEIKVSGQDKELLQNVIDMGNLALANQLWCVASIYHEMPLYLENGCSPSIRRAWALDGRGDTPTLLGATQLRSLQKLVTSISGDLQPLQTLETAGNAEIQMMKDSLADPAPRKSKVAKIKRRIGDLGSSLAGGVKVGEEISPKRKKIRNDKKLLTPTSVASLDESMSLDDSESSVSGTLFRISAMAPINRDLFGSSSSSQRSHLINGSQSINTAIETDTSGMNQADSDYKELLESASLVSTASAKLSYLIDQVLQHFETEKIIIFYENDNVAYYIAQALEIIHVEHLIYAKSLTSERRSQYIVTFNSTPRFRCLLMDISQAAFGLDLSSASRVYFVNPVLSKQVEAQAVKRAHRIGQRKPVYVETLVLRDSIEEVIIERRNTMSKDEQKKCKTVLDDQTMYDWIKNVRLVPISDNGSQPDQMAKLQNPQHVFTATATHNPTHDPDSGLVTDGFYQSTANNSSEQQTAQSNFGLDGVDETEDLRLSVRASPVLGFGLSRSREVLGRPPASWLEPGDHPEVPFSNLYFPAPPGYTLRPYALDTSDRSDTMFDPRFQNAFSHRTPPVASSLRALNREMRNRPRREPIGQIIDGYSIVAMQRQAMRIGEPSLIIKIKFKNSSFLSDLEYRLLPQVPRSRNTGHPDQNGNTGRVVEVADEEGNSSAPATNVTQQG